MEPTKPKIKLHARHAENDYIRDIDEKIERREYQSVLGFKEIEENGAKTKDENVITGYAAVFNKDSEDFGGWVERIAPGAFGGVLEDECFALFNHDMNMVLGRNGVNVTLSQDDNGLLYSIKLPDTSIANDVRALVKAGIINKSSFAFTVAEESFIKADPKNNMPNMRIINKIEQLYDVSPVTRPAYPDTSVAARGFKKMEAQEEIRMSLLEMRLKSNINKLKFNKQLNKN